MGVGLGRVRNRLGEGNKEYGEGEWGRSRNRVIEV